MMGGLRHWRPRGEHSSDLEWHSIKKRTVCTKNKLNRILGGKRESEWGKIQPRSSPPGATKGFMHSNTKQINETRRMWISLWLFSVPTFVLLLAQPQPSPCLRQPHCSQWVQELALTYSPVYRALCYVAPPAVLLVIFPVRGEEHFELMSQLRLETCRSGDHHSTRELTKPTVSNCTSVKAS